MDNVKELAQIIHDVYGMDKCSLTIKRITEINQMIVYHKRFEYDLLCDLTKVLKQLRLPHTFGIKSVVIKMKNCNIKLFRKD